MGSREARSFLYGGHWTIAVSLFFGAATSSTLCAQTVIEPPRTGDEVVQSLRNRLLVGSPEFDAKPECLVMVRTVEGLGLTLDAGPTGLLGPLMLQAMKNQGISTYKKAVADILSEKRQGELVRIVLAEMVRAGLRTKFVTITTSGERFVAYSPRTRETDDADITCRSELVIKSMKLEVSSAAYNLRVSLQYKDNVNNQNEIDIAPLMGLMFERRYKDNLVYIQSRLENALVGAVGLLRYHDREFPAMRR